MTDDLIQKELEVILDKQLSGYEYLISDYATSSESEARYAKEQQEERKKIVKEILSLVHKIKDEAKREAIDRILAMREPECNEDHGRDCGEVDTKRNDVIDEIYLSLKEDGGEKVTK